MIDEPAGVCPAGIVLQQFKKPSLIHFSEKPTPGNAF
jgi:hypothetical protein